MKNVLTLSDEERKIYEWQMWVQDFGEEGSRSEERLYPDFPFVVDWAVWLLMNWLPPEWGPGAGA